MSQRYRLRNPASGREIVIEAKPEEIYLDRDTGEPLEIVGPIHADRPFGEDIERIRLAAWPAGPGWPA